MKSFFKLSLILLFLFFPHTITAEVIELDGIRYYLNGNEATVTYYGDSFYSIGNLYTGFVVIPKTINYNGITYSVTSIGDDAFNNCPNLTGIEIPESVTYIGANAFKECIGLTSVVIPNNVSYIGFSAFYECSGLISVEIPNSVKFIGSHTFYNCRNLASIEIPDSLTSINNGVFLNCFSLTNIDIPNSVTSIGEFAFGGCRAIKDIEIPNSVTSIGQYAFSDCQNLNSITIPNSVTSIGDWVLWYCGSLKSIIVDSGNQYYDSRNNCNSLIETASNILIAGCRNSFIPNSVTTICDGAFGGCNELTNIEIPNSVTSIGIYAFSGCKRLKSIEIPHSVTNIGDYAFDDCPSLVSIEIPNSLISIGQNAFYYSNSINTLIITGEGEWQGVNLSIISSSPTLYIDNRITGLKGIRAPHFDVYCYATTPPSCNENSFTNYSGTLHVPAASVAAYFISDFWCNFANIVGDAVEPNVTISQDSVEFNLGNQFILTASVVPANATPNNILWKSTNTNIATVNNGIVTAIGAGECDIIAQCLNKKAICHVVVNDTTITITLDQQEVIVLPNHIITLSPSASPVMPDLAVSSNDPSVAAARVVNNKVQVVGIKEGTTTITVGSVDGTAIPATCLVTVYTEPGDINCDGFVNISDVTSLIDYLLSGDGSLVSTKNADVNGDESINISDVTTLIDILLQGN